MNKSSLNKVENIMAALEASKVVPRSRFWFALNNYSLWCVWLLTIIFGSITLSIFWYTLESGWYGFYEATHSSWFSFMLDSVPLIWFPLFILLLLLAYVDMRHTRLGYRYPMWQIIGSSLIFSLVGGIVCAYLGIGKIIDRQLGEFVPTYHSQLRAEKSLWQVPQSGRLTGVVSIDNEEILVTDPDDIIWRLDVSNIDGMDTKMLVPGMHVRLLGLPGDSNFVVCGVLPGMKNDDMPARKMKPYHVVVKERLQRLQEKKNAVGEELNPCVKIPMPS